MALGDDQVFPCGCGFDDISFPHDCFPEKVEKERYIMLDEEDFACLVRGGVVHWGNIKIALRDIGYIQMDIAIANAEAGIDIRKDHVRKG